MQWGSKNLTKLIDRIEMNSGYMAFNNSIPAVFEVCGDCKDSPFTFLDIKRLLDYWPGGHQSNERTSLLNFTNCEYLLANQGRPEAIAERFAINTPQAVSLIEYSKSLFRSYGILSDTPTIDYFRGCLV
jgi:hypothetical protein